MDKELFSESDIESDIEPVTKKIYKPKDPNYYKTYYIEITKKKIQEKKKQDKTEPKKRGRKVGYRKTKPNSLNIKVFQSLFYLILYFLIRLRQVAPQ
jgi:hypothetical protein